MSDTEAICRRWLLGGRVQGVGFRWFVLRAARSIGVAGTVCNLPDGRVEVVARGAAGDLDRLELKLREGPGFARVRDVHREPGVLPEDLDDFRVIG